MSEAEEIADKIFKDPEFRKEWSEYLKEEIENENRSERDMVKVLAVMDELIGLLPDKKKARKKLREKNRANAEMFDVEFNYIRQSNKAILVHRIDIDEMFWIPKSLIDNEEAIAESQNMEVDDKIKLTLPKWYCEKELKFD